MDYKQEGDKITPVMQPGTVEAYQPRSTSIRAAPGARKPNKASRHSSNWVSGIETKEKVTGGKPVKH